MNLATHALNTAHLPRGFGARSGDATERIRNASAPPAGERMKEGAPMPPASGVGMFARLEALMPGDPSLVRRALGGFVIQHSGDAERLAELIAAKHGPGVRRLAGALTKSACQIGAIGLAEEAQALGCEWESESDAGARAALERLRNALRLTIDAADAWLAAHPPAAPQPVDRDRELDASLAKLQTMVAARDWGSLREAEHIAGTARGRLTALQVAKLDAVIAALRRFGFDQAALGVDSLRKARA